MTAWLQKSYKNVNQTNEFRLRILGNKEVFEKFKLGGDDGSDQSPF